MREKMRPVEGLENRFRRKAWNTKLERKSVETEGKGKE